jgi:hypothetical protein
MRSHIREAVCLSSLYLQDPAQILPKVEMRNYGWKMHFLVDGIQDIGCCKDESRGLILAFQGVDSRNKPTFPLQHFQAGLPAHCISASSFAARDYDTSLIVVL